MCFRFKAIDRPNINILWIICSLHCPAGMQHTQYMSLRCMHAVSTVNSVCSLGCSAIHIRAPLALQCAASLDLQFAALGFCRIMQLLAVCSIMHYAAGCRRAQILGEILKSRDKDLPLLSFFSFLDRKSVV